MKLNFWNRKEKVVEGRMGLLLVPPCGALGCFEYNASVSIEFKEGRYRVEQSDMITYFINASAFNSKSKMTEESQIMKQNGTFRTANGVVKQMADRNKEFNGIFKLKTIDKKDW